MRESEESKEICAARESRIAGSTAMLAGLGTTGVLGILRQALLIDVPYAWVALCFALGAAAGPLIGAIAKRLTKKRLDRVDDARTEDGPPSELRARLRVVGLAEASERKSYALGHATALAYSPAMIVVALSLFDGANLELLGKALSAAFSFGWPLLSVLFGTAYLQMRRLTGRDRQRASVWTASAAIPFFTAAAAGAVVGAINGFPIVPSIFFSGVAASVISVPAVWWSMRRLYRERDRLAVDALPSRFEDSDDTRRLLASTVEWSGGPSAIRADALRGLAQRVKPDELAPYLARALEDGDAELARASLSISAERRALPALDRLLELTNSGDDATLCLLPPLLSRHRDPRIEPALRAMLKPELPRASAASAQALGLVGSIDIVEALRRAADFAGPGKLRAICAEAIERIHIRIKGGPGQLALVAAADEGGSLSHPEAQGALSVPQD